MHGFIDSPFAVPVAAFAAWFGVVTVKTVARYKVRQLQSQERLAAIEKGQPVPETAEEFAGDAPRQGGGAKRRIAVLRTSGIVCVATGIGTALFFIMVAKVVQEPKVLCGAATALIPLAIGIGLLIDMKMQKKSLAEEQQNPAN